MLFNGQALFCDFNSEKLIAGVSIISFFYYTEDTENTENTEKD